MNEPPLSDMFLKNTKNYLNLLVSGFTVDIIKNIEFLALDIRKAWINKNHVFICGNGGSAGNAIHLANDFIYGIGVSKSGDSKVGLNVEALSANPAVLTCLANDTGYENIFSKQLITKAIPGDLLIVLSGSGNSPNIIKALEIAKELGIKSYAIIAFDGGKSKLIADVPIHFSINDMQIAEDTQLIIGHLCMQWLCNNKPD